MKTKRNIASILLVAFATLGFMASCTGNEKKIVSGNYTLTLDGLEYKEEKLTDEFCDFTLIPLETNEKEKHRNRYYCGCSCGCHDSGCFRLS